MIKGIYRFLLCAVFCGFCVFHATAATSLFSNYGQIQNVQNYSTNPFWTPNAPYNQRLPQPVYVQGADLTAEDCFKAVQSLVSVQCMARDNCKNTTLAEIRPTVMVQLSNLPGNNYVSACSGYIDTIFEQYVAQYGNSVPNRAVAFPTATTPNQNLNDNNNSIEIKNPYQQIPNQWQRDYIERSNELQQLQQQNGTGSEQLSVTDFPTTFEDLSFSERMAVKAEGYEPYKDLQAYIIPNFQSAEEWCSGTGANSEECKKIATCKTAMTDVNAVQIEEDKEGNCKIKSCKAGYEPSSDFTKCESLESKECKSSDPNATASKYNSKGECIITSCKEGFETDSTQKKCVSVSGKDCESTDKKATVSKLNAKGECIIIECRKGYIPSTNGKTCEKISGDPCTPQGDKNATAGQYDEEGNCVSTDCKYGYEVGTEGKCERNMCPKTKHALRSRTALFSFADINTPEAAKRILEELIRCSDTPDAIATKNYTTRGGSGRKKNDYMIVKTADGNSLIGEFVFDDVTDGHHNQFFVETFICLALIAMGASSSDKCSVQGRHNGAECKNANIDTEQFKELRKTYQNIIGTSSGYDIFMDGNTIKFKITR